MPGKNILGNCGSVDAKSYPIISSVSVAYTAASNTINCGVSGVNFVQYYGNTSGESDHAWSVRLPMQFVLNAGNQFKDIQSVCAKTRGVSVYSFPRLNDAATVGSFNCSSGLGDGTTPYTYGGDVKVNGISVSRGADGLWSISGGIALIPIPAYSGGDPHHDAALGYFNGVFSVTGIDDASIIGSHAITISTDYHYDCQNDLDHPEIVTHSTLTVIQTLTVTIA